MKVKEAYIAYRSSKKGVPSQVLHGPRDVVSVMQDAFAQRPDQESFWIVLVDCRLRAIARSCCFIGTLDGVTIHPREILRIAVLAAAHSFFVVHNHPSGDPAPSDADLRVTKQLEGAANLIGIPMLDHIIVGDVENDPNGLGYRSLLGA